MPADDPTTSTSSAGAAAGAAAPGLSRFGASTPMRSLRPKRKLAQADDIDLDGINVHVSTSESLRDALRSYVQKKAMLMELIKEEISTDKELLITAWFLQSECAQQSMGSIGISDELLDPRNTVLKLLQGSVKHEWK